MIELNEDLLIGLGSKRFCYLHPEDNKLIIKVKNPDCKKQKDFNHDEYKCFIKAKETYGDEVLSFLPNYYGFSETNLGQGLMTDNLGDNRLYELIKTGRFTFEPLIEALESFVHQIRKLNIFIRDPRLTNFVFCDGKIYHFDLDGFDQLRPEKKLLFFVPKSFFVNRSLNKFKKRMIKHFKDKITPAELARVKAL